MKKQAYKTKTLTPAQKKFATVFAHTDNATEAVRAAYPELAGKASEAYLRLKGHRLITKDNVMNEITSQKQKMEAISARSVNRLTELVDSENEVVALNASKFAIEQVHGKAVQKIEAKSAHVSVIYNLGGDNTPEIPAEILAKIQANK